ncbi:MAG: hypothetical protein LBQ24_03515 [Candidatus Peribacteria bacterium]|nr:hypothetical protein [Candidatus Peribacteria bacterium]
MKPIDSTVAMLLFETNIFTTEEKIKLAKLFFPTISVRELRRFEIF